MKILMVNPNLPYPPRSGNTIRLFNLIKGLSQTDKVDLIAIVSDNSTTQEDIASLRKYCRNVYLASRTKQSRLRQVWSIIRKISIGEPFFTKYVQSADLERLLYRITLENQYDIITIEHSVMAKYLDFLHPHHNAKTVLVMHDIASSLYERRYRSERKVLEKLKLLLTCLPLRKWEVRMARRFSRVVTMSGADRELFLSLGSGCTISVVANGVDTGTYLPFPQEDRGKNILLIGSMDYKPNVDAAHYFVRDIFPAVRKRHPDCTLTIVGKSAPEDIQRLTEEPGVNVHSDVDDVRPYYKKALVSVVPLRSGGGTRLKILEAMALGTPVVSTSIGCEGLDVANNRNILIADEPADFAQQITNLLTDLELWNRLSLNGRALVQKNYDWEQITREYRAMLEELTVSNFAHPQIMPDFLTVEAVISPRP